MWQPFFLAQAPDLQQLFGKHLADIRAGAAFTFDVSF